MGDNATGADNQQERPGGNSHVAQPRKKRKKQAGDKRLSLGILRDHTPDSTDAAEEKRWSDLHGDMQRSAEMTGPFGGSRRATTCLR